MGGSAASAVAGAVAADAVFGARAGADGAARGRPGGGGGGGRPPRRQRRAVACGAARCWCWAWTRRSSCRGPVHPDLGLVLVTPAYAVETAQARAVLPARGVARRRDRAGRGPGGPAGRARAGRRSISSAARWWTASRSPSRLPLYPGYPEARAAGLGGGRAGVAVSGAGPTVMAVVRAGHRGCGGRGHAGGVRAPRHRGGGPRGGGRPDGRAGARLVSASLVCAACGARLRWQDPRASCACGGLLEVSHEGGPRGRALRAIFDRRLPRRPGRAGQRRLAIPRAAGPGPHAAGDAPRGQHARSTFATPVSRYAGVADLGLKHEGENPTGSFKDRGMTVAVTHAVRAGASAVACASTGNTSASHGRVRGAVRPAGARVRARRQGGGGQAGPDARVRRAHAPRARRLRRLPAPGPRGIAPSWAITLLNSVNPWRIEGQKTIVLELLQQRGWDPPDWIVVPAGNLGNTAAFGKALREAKERGLIARAARGSPPSRPTGAAPFFRSFRGGFAEALPRCSAETVATAIRIGDPASYDRARPRDTRDPRRGGGGERRRDPRSEGGRGRGGHRLRAGLGRVGGGRAAAASARA